MANKVIHPESHLVLVVLSDGTKFNIYTTYGKEGDTMRLDIDPTNHPAWKTQQGIFVNTRNDNVAKFKKKHGNVFNSN